jgi:hypothetical protein
VGRKETPDRNKINIHDPAEVKWWSRELDVSREQLRSGRQGRKFSRHRQKGVGS